MRGQREFSLSCGGLLPLRSNCEPQEPSCRKNNQAQFSLFLAPQSDAPYTLRMVKHRSNSAVVLFRDVILEMANNPNMTLKAIADVAHTTRSRISDFLKDEGIHRNPWSYKGNRNPRWKGGRILDKSGYVLIYMPDYPGRNHLGYVREHRRVMEEHLGRLLLPTEVVHHKNRNKQDNRICNLGLYSKNSEHLADELKGKVPKWTEDGLARMKAGILRSAVVRRERIAQSSKQSASRSRKTSNRPRKSLRINRRALSEMEYQPSGVQSWIEHMGPSQFPPNAGLTVPLPSTG